MPESVTPERSTAGNGADDLAVKWVLQGSHEAQTEQLLALIHDEALGEQARYEFYLHNLRRRRGRDRRIAFFALIGGYVVAIATFLGLAVLAATMEGTTSQIVVAVAGAASSAIACVVYIYLIRKIVERRREVRAQTAEAATAWKKTGLRYREAQ